MKKLYTLVILSGICSSFCAQPVINSAGFTNSTTVLNYTGASPEWLATFDPATAGADLTWNFSVIPTTGAIQTQTYVAVTATPISYQFFFNNQFLYPTNLSNHALPVEAGGVDLPIDLPVNDAYVFFRNANNGYFITGVGAAIPDLPIPLSVPFEQPDRVFKFPVNFGDIDSTLSKFSIALPGVGYYGQEAKRYNHADAWGTLQLPGASYQVLRVRSERYISDSIYIEDGGMGQFIERPLQVDYAWLSPNVPGPVMEATVIAGQVVSTRVLHSVGPLSTSQAELKGVKVYPNPANQRVAVEGLEQPSEVSIYDLSGKLTLRVSYTNANPGIDISGLPAGIYLLNVVNSSGVFSTRLAVTH